MPESKLIPSTPGYFKWSLIVLAQYMFDPFLHKIAIGSVILDPKVILMSLSLSCIALSISS